jgi:hypothetical protein
MYVTTSRGMLLNCTDRKIRNYQDITKIYVDSVVRSKCIYKYVEDLNKQKYIQKLEFYSKWLRDGLMFAFHCKNYKGLTSKAFV